MSTKEHSKLTSLCLVGFLARASYALARTPVLAQSPLPCAHEKVPNPPSEFRRVELNR